MRATQVRRLCTLLDACLCVGAIVCWYRRLTHHCLWHRAFQHISPGTVPAYIVRHIMSEVWSNTELSDSEVSGAWVVSFHVLGSLTPMFRVRPKHCLATLVFRPRARSAGKTTPWNRWTTVTSLMSCGGSHACMRACIHAATVVATKVCLYCMYYTTSLAVAPSNSDTDTSPNRRHTAPPVRVVVSHLTEAPSSLPLLPPPPWPLALPLPSPPPPLPLPFLPPLPALPLPLLLLLLPLVAAPS